MVTLRKCAAASIAFCLLLNGSELIFGQQQSEQQQNDQQKANQQTNQKQAAPNMPTIRSLMEAKVLGSGGQQVGKVVDFVVDGTGFIDYVVVSHKQKNVLIPWTAANTDFQQHVVRLNIDKARFQQLPTFAEGNMPNLEDGQYTQKLSQVLGTSSAPQRRATTEHGARAAEDWIYHNGTWMMQHPGDNRWYTTDGNHWYYWANNRWNPYRFNGQFGANFRRYKYRIPGRWLFLRPIQGGVPYYNSGWY